MGNCSSSLSKESESRLHLSSSRKKEKMDSKPVKEFHKTLIITHTLEVGDLTMVEVIEETTVTPQDSKKPTTKIVVHKRQIGNKSLIMKQVNGKKEELSDLDPKERKEFDQQWKKHWKPTMTQEKIIRSLQEDNPDDGK
jgi:hypothetical protein